MPIPVLPNIASAFDTALYVKEGDYVEAGKAAIGIPLGILGKGAGKLAPKVGESVTKVAETVAKEGSGKAVLRSLGSKSESYIVKRGWTLDTIQEVVNNPYTTREAVNKATGNAATAYYNKAGDYVVVDNITGELLQTSKFGDTGWIPDSTIINPYKP